MDNLQNLSLLFHEQNVFTAVSLGIFFVFICGITKSLLYLAGEKASYLFDSNAISKYITKTAAPEPIRLKIMFLSYPKADKTLLAQYLKEPTEKPSKVFAGTIEQLKCEILTVTNYNRNVAMFFFLVSGVTILSSSIASLDTKLLGITIFALVLFSVDTTCNGIFAVMKYFSLKSFRALISKLDDFHGMHNAKFRNGLLTEQNPNSPLAKSCYPTAAYQKPSTAITTKPQLANFEISPEDDLRIGVIRTPKIQTKEILPKRPHQAIDPENLIRPKTSAEAVIDINNKQEEKTQKPTTQDSPISVSSLLENIKIATDTLDFESFEALSDQLSTLCTASTLAPNNHQTLQKGLDALLNEFRSVEEGVGGGA